MVVKMFVFMVDNEAFEEKVIWHLFKIELQIVLRTYKIIFFL